MPFEDLPIARRLASTTPVVVMGRGHSGTRLLTEALERLGLDLGTRRDATSCDCFDRRFTRMITAIAAESLGIQHPEEVRWWDALRFRLAANRYHRALGRPVSDWGWKFPETYLIAPCVERVFPRARYVHLVRDGRDIAFKSHLTDNPRRRLGRRILQRLGAEGASPPVRAALSWSFQLEHFRAFVRGLPPDRLVEVRFEDLCRNPGAVMQRVCEFLSQPMTAACETFLDRSIDPGKVAQWRSQERVALHEVERRILPMLRCLEYA